MGIDRDSNGVLDADEPLPRLQITLAGANTVINWPLNASGFQMETATSLTSEGWSNVSGPVEIVGGQNFMTNAAAPGAKFFRLRQP
jgi:hypothetical protein